MYVNYIKYLYIKIYYYLYCLLIKECGKYSYIVNIIKSNRTGTLIYY